MTDTTIAPSSTGGRPTSETDTSETTRIKNVTVQLPTSTWIVGTNLAPHPIMIDDAGQYPSDAGILLVHDSSSEKLNRSSIKREENGEIVRHVDHSYHDGVTIIQAGPAGLVKKSLTGGGVSGEVSWVGAFFDGLTAGGYTVIDAFTPDLLLDVKQEKAAAWRTAGLEGTWTQAISESAATVAVGATIGVVAAPIATAATAASASVPGGTFLLGAGFKGLGVYGAYHSTLGFIDGVDRLSKGDKMGLVGVTNGVVDASLSAFSFVQARNLANAGRFSSGADDLDIPTSARNVEHELPVIQEWCFAPDTLVDTPLGQRKIADIAEGDGVFAFDFTTGQWIVRTVVERHDSRYLGAIVTLHTSDGEVTATAYHPFWVIEGHDLAARPRCKELAEHEDEGESLPGRWVNSHDLLPGDVLHTRDGRRLRLLRLEQRYEENFRVCNLSIDTNHSFAVGQAALLVHNTTGCGFTGTVPQGKPPLVNGSKYREGWDRIFGATHGHHTYPKALGGHPDQDLSNILESMHTRKGGIHSDLAKFEGGWLRPRKGMTGADIVEEFGQDVVEDGFRRFYSQDKWHHLLDAFEDAVDFTRKSL